MTMRARAAAALGRIWSSISRLGSVALAVALCVAVAGLLIVSYRTIDQWQQSSRLLMEERTQVMLTLLMAALDRDMKGAQVSVLLPLELADVMSEPPYDLRDVFASAFARFPYVESFFLVKRGADGATTLDTFNRAERPPAWDGEIPSPHAYPAVLRRNPPAGKMLIASILPHADRERRFAVFESLLGGTRYQVVAKLLRESPSSPLQAIVGFTINVPWLREHYFRELASEVSRVGDPGGSVVLAIHDDRGNTIAETAPLERAVALRTREFLPLFFDPVMLPMLTENAPALKPWMVRVGADDERTLAAARGATRVAYATLSGAAIASVVGMLLTMRALRSRAKLMAMQSDFVCTVTHELKTPVAFIRLLGETLSQGRYNSLDTIHEYARMLSQETWRLTRLIDNVLTFARVNQVTPESRDSIEVAEMFEEVLSHFRPQLAERNFHVTVHVTPESVRIVGDRVMITQAVDNLVANAIKYSQKQCVLGIDARQEGEWVHLEVTDRGIGIPAAELPRVFEKFFRGRSGDTRGSGLGLAIVKRVVEEHGGTAAISSVVGEGTTVRLVLPA